MSSKQFARRISCAAAAVGVVGGVLAASPASAYSPTYTHNFAFVWSSQPSSPLNVPVTTSTAYSYNSRVGQPTVTRTSTGRYTVKLANQVVGAGGNVQVSAYGSKARRCNVVNWVPSGSTLNVNVSCYDRSRAADSMFTMQFLNRPATPSVTKAYAWSYTTASTTLTGAYQYNSAGGAVRQTRNGTGDYTVSFDGLKMNGGHVAVTSYGATGKYCKVGYWSSNAANVRCFNNFGAPSDSAFSLSLTDQSVSNNLGDGAYWWHSQPTNPAMHHATAPYWWHSYGNSITVRRQGTGRYTFDVPTIPDSKATNVMMTAYGSSSATCQVERWLPLNVGTRVYALCHTASGAPADSMLTASVVRSN